AAGKITKLEYTVKIPPLVIEIQNLSEPSSSIIRVQVDPAFKGIWSLDKAFGAFEDRYRDSYEGPVETRNYAEIYCLENTVYTVIFAHIYGNREYRFYKEIE